MVVTHKLSVDLEGKGPLPWIEVNQWDACSREVRALLCAGKIPWEVPEDGSVVVYARKPDGTCCAYDTLPDGTKAWRLEGNLLAFSLAPQILTVSGRVMLYASILREAAVLTTVAMEVRVRHVEIGRGRGLDSESFYMLTGILPAPEGAKAGQYVQVAEVNAAGKIIRVEAVELPECAMDEKQVLGILEDYLEENPPAAGKDGADGISVTHNWEGTTLTVTSASGTSSADLKGERGYRGNSVVPCTYGGAVLESGTIGEASRYFEAMPMLFDMFITPEGCLCKVTAVSISTDSEDFGIDYALVAELKGADGYRPVRGVDYFTEADQEAIVQQVIAALGSPVFGRVDEENNIILSGELADGTYVVKYEDGEGNATVIGAIQQGIAEAVRYGYVYGTCNRVGGDDYRMFHDDLDGETNYYMIYQDSGDAPLHADNTITTASKYYPLKVPAGKTKIRFTFPNLQNPLLMAVPTLSLSDGVYTRINNSGWLTEGVYEYEFGTDVQYISANFRNNAYSGLHNYDISGFTLEWL